MKYIIVKYAKYHYPKGKAPLNHSIYNTYSAIQCDCNKQFYLSKEEAEKDLKFLNEYNPTVGYGIVEAIE